MIKATVIIPTIGRSTLIKSIDSVLRESMDLIVIGDGSTGLKNKLPKGVRYVELGKNFGLYGFMCYNVGAALAETDFICSLADDDELGICFGEELGRVLNTKKDVDIWIPRLIFTNGNIWCNDGSFGVVKGNVAAPIYRREIFENIPFTRDLTKDVACVDYYHVLKCHRNGYKVDWCGSLDYLVRPYLFSIDIL